MVTPYFAETDADLTRCLASVRRQTVPCDHILVADGRPRDLSDVGVRHLVLDRNVGDCGNTPRGLGGLLAINGPYDLVTFLDADNWIDPDHLETALAAAERAERKGGGSVDVVFARRRFFRPDGSRLPVEEEDPDRHVDANCYVFRPGGFHLIAWWGVVPRELGSTADRLFRGYLARQQGLRTLALTRPTVNYVSRWAAVYRALGETPPEGAKTLPGLREAEWLNGLAPRQREIAERRAGVPLKPPPPEELTRLRRADPLAAPPKESEEK